MGTNWTFTAMPMMINAFLVKTPCSNNTNCIIENESLSGQFKLINNYASLDIVAASFFLVGINIGNIISSPLSDYKGRRIIIVSCMFGMSLFGFFAAIAPGIYWFIIFRCIQGIFFSGSSITSWILAYESIPITLRNYTSLLFGLYWVFGYTLIGLLAYYIRNWRILISVISLPQFLFSIIYYFTIPESFHYLLVKGKINEAKNWINKANYYAKFNNSKQVNIDVDKLCNSIIQKLNDEKELMKQKSFIQKLFCNRLLIIYLIIFIYLCTCDTFIYYGLSLFSNITIFNKYINFILIGLIEIPSYLLTPILLKKLGRKYFFSLCHGFSTISFIFIIFTDNSTIHLIMSLFGKFSISCAFILLFVYASEVFPTIMRNKCIGICEIIGRIGGVCAPYIGNLSIYSAILPPTLFALSAAIATLIIFLLPKTDDCDLPNSTEDVK